MAVLVKKCAPDPFQAMLDGLKPFEYRREDDCTYEVGDLLVLLEWLPPVIVDTYPTDRYGWRDSEDPVKVEEEPARYSGRVLKRRVTYLLRGPDFGIPEGYCCMAVVPEDRP